MQDADALVSDMLIHGQRAHPDAAVAEFHGAATSSTSFADLAARAGRLAGRCRDWAWAAMTWWRRCAGTPRRNLAAYFAVPSIGAVLHILNLRLSDDQLAYIVNHAGDRVVIVDGDLVRQLARILPRCLSVRDVIMAGPAATPASSGSNRPR